MESLHSFYVEYGRLNIGTRTMISFCVSLILSPYSYGFMFYILSSMFLEVIVLCHSVYVDCPYTLRNRIYIFVASIFGWLLGRISVQNI